MSVLTPYSINHLWLHDLTMAVLGIDLGGTKLASAVFSEQGALLSKEIVALGVRQGAEVGALITAQLKKHLADRKDLQSIGVSVPGICRSKTGTVWAPNIAGWDNYPLQQELQREAGTIPVIMDSDRACYILGERWQGNARGCKDAIFLAIGTGIGAGIIVNGTILRGAHDIAGAVGWMALDRPYLDVYTSCGCLEYHASGEGIAKVARKMLQEKPEYQGLLSHKASETMTAHDVFKAYEQKDTLATAVMQQCVAFWGMAVANLVSIFNPEKILFGGGVFGPGVQFLEAIRQEACQWAQPISMAQVSLEKSQLEGDAGLYGAGYLALQHQYPV